MISIRAKLLILILPFFIFSCAAPATQIHEEDKKFILDVPFFKQEENLCAVSALQSLFSYYNVKVPFEEIKENVFNENIQSSHIIDILAFAKMLGLEANVKKATLDDIVTNIFENRPVIALIDRGFLNLAKGHYVVITGIDLRGSLTGMEGQKLISFYMHDGITENIKISKEKFLKKWKKAGNQIIIITP